MARLPDDFLAAVLGEALLKQDQRDQEAGFDINEPFDWREYE